MEPEPIFDEDALEQVGRSAAERAWAEGMTVLRPDGTVVPIPLMAEPEVRSRSELAALASEAEAILSGAVKLARALLRAGDARDRAALEEPFSGLEAEAMAKLFDGAPLPVVVARVDFLVPEAGGGGARPRAERDDPGDAGVCRSRRVFVDSRRGPRARPQSS